GDTTSDGMLRLSVSDTGNGIDPSQMDRLFTPFERLGAEQSGIEGTGMGLALSKRLVEVMGGEIGVDSRPGGGSTFWVRLPLSGSPEEEVGIELPAEPLHAGNGRSRKVLYIEDNLSNLRLIERVLAHRPEV